MHSCSKCKAPDSSHTVERQGCTITRTCRICGLTRTAQIIERANKRIMKPQVHPANVPGRPRAAYVRELRVKPCENCGEPFESYCGRFCESCKEVRLRKARRLFVLNFRRQKKEQPIYE